MRTKFLEDFLASDRPTRQRFIGALLDRIKERLDNIDLLISNSDAAPKGIAAAFVGHIQRAKEDRADIIAILQALVEAKDWDEAVESELEFRRTREAARRRAAKPTKPKPGRPPSFLAVFTSMMDDLRNETVTLDGLRAMRQEQLVDRYGTSRATVQKALDAVKKIVGDPGLSETVKNSVVELRPTKPRGNPS